MTICEKITTDEMLDKIEDFGIGKVEREKQRDYIQMNVDKFTLPDRQLDETDLYFLNELIRINTETAKRIETEGCPLIYVEHDKPKVVRFDHFKK